MDHEKWLEQHDRMMADQAEATARHELWLAHHEQAMARHDEAFARHEETIARIDQRLDRAVRLAVQDARRHRTRNLKFDVLINQIAAAQLVNEELLKAFLKRGGNGNS